MANFQEIISVNDLNNGAVDEIVKAKLPEILKNLGDENTSWKTERGIDIKIRFKLSTEARETMVTTIAVTPKLAPPKASESVAYLKYDGKGISAHAMKDDPEQMELEENVAEFPQEEAK